MAGSFLNCPLGRFRAFSIAFDRRLRFDAGGSGDQQNAYSGNRGARRRVGRLCLIRSDITPAYVSPVTTSHLRANNSGWRRNPYLPVRLPSPARKIASDTKDAVATTAAAVIIFWPAAFLVGGDKQTAAELAQMKGTDDCRRAGLDCEELQDPVPQGQRPPGSLIWLGTPLCSCGSQD